MEETQRRFPVGSIIIGIVREHAPFGVFVDLNDPVAFGLIEIPEFRDEGRMTPEQYPPVGSTVRLWSWPIRYKGSGIGFGSRCDRVEWQTQFRNCPPFALRGGSVMLGTSCWNFRVRSLCSRNAS